MCRVHWTNLCWCHATNTCSISLCIKKIVLEDCNKRVIYVNKCDCLNIHTNIHMLVVTQTQTRSISSLKCWNLYFFVHLHHIHSRIASKTSDESRYLNLWQIDEFIWFVWLAILCLLIGTSHYVFGSRTIFLSVSSALMIDLIYM